MMTPTQEDGPVLYVCHANPADNSFATWLGSRLSSAGYRVVIDLVDPAGGGKPWNKIEAAIREAAIRFLAVTSRASREIEDVASQINIAKGVEAERRCTDFIIPLRIDDLPHSQVPPALNNKTGISFESDWGDGLQKLFVRLRNEGILPSGHAPTASDFYASVLASKADRLVRAEEPAFLNWLPVVDAPALYVYSFHGVAKISAERIRSAGVPAFVANAGTVISFGAPDTIAFASGTDSHSLQYSVSTTAEWIAVPSQATRKERCRTLVGLLNSAWELSLGGRGWSPLRLSNETAYFVPSATRGVVKQPYRDPLGRTTRPVTIVGESKKHAAFWHAAISGRAILHPIPHFAIKLHVGFTNDGFTPIADGERAFRLRRSFCKAFWNDRWRRLYFALFERLASGSDTVRLDTGGETPILLAQPVALTVPYTIASDPAAGYQDDEDILPEADSGVFVEFDDVDLDEATNE